MPKVSKHKVGFVSLWLVEGQDENQDNGNGRVEKSRRRQKWKATWTDPATGRWMRRILPVDTYKDAVKVASEINEEVSAGRGYGGRRRRGAASHSISDAVEECVKNCGANDRTKREYFTRFNPFVAYLLGNAKKIRAWRDITEPVVLNYLRHCRNEGLAYDTIRQRLTVLKMASRFMGRTYPAEYRDALASIKHRRDAPTAAELEAGESILSPHEIRTLLDWLRDREPMIHTWATMQSLAGMRIYEGAYRREMDFNPAEGTLFITEVPGHRPKNRASFRKIPICPAIVETLSDWIDRMKVRSPHGYLFFPERTVTANGAYRPDYVSQLWTIAVRRARLEGLELPEKFTGRRLRASFVTAMRRVKVDVPTLQHYIGHAQGTILGQHYDVMDDERLQGVADMAQELFEGTGAFQMVPKTAKKERA